MPRREETERLCALTREVKPIADLIRFAVSPDGELVPDTDGKAEGRGVWISLGERQVAEAQKKKAFARSLKAEVKVPDDLAGLTRRRLEERFLSLGEIADLKIGDVIELQATPRSRVKLESNQQGLFWCHIGQSEGAYVLKVDELIDQEKEFLDDVLPR